jgi:16S rRNA (adenine1518-N6/adenine1519-N6)-dimethyltransferase
MGQNFLANPSTAETIISRAHLSSEDVVLEIGAGLGALTIGLARTVKKVYAVEKDRQLVDLLKAELLANRIFNCEIIPNNILFMDLDAIAKTIGTKITVFGNLPYGISSQILVKLIQSRSCLDRTILMFQKELAQRISAQPGGRDYGRISAMLRYCANIQRLAHIRASVFYPPPKVDSTVIEIRFKSTAIYGPHDEAMLFDVIKAAFGNRRKTLKNALAASGLGINTQTALRALDLAGIDPSRRAETLGPAEFVSLEISLRAALEGRSSIEE